MPKEAAGVVGWIVLLYKILERLIACITDHNGLVTMMGFRQQKHMA
jgi:hypothetical protein